MKEYHDKEWGTPVYDDDKMFEFFTLEGAQAGLSWITVLRKRDEYRRAYQEFKIETVASFSDSEVERIIQDFNIVKNRLKVRSAITNAKKILEVREEFSTFHAYLWKFVKGAPVISGWKEQSEIPTFCKIAVDLSKDLKKRGFSFVGPTICYSHMQAVGMVNDHVTDCFRYRQLTG